MINRVRCCPVECGVPTFAWRVGANLGSTEHKAGFRLYKKAANHGNFWRCCTSCELLFMGKRSVN
jgi:hypothetical protein